MEHQWNEIDRGKPKTRKKTCPSATLFTTNLTWSWSGTEPRASVVRDRRLTTWAMARPYMAPNNNIPMNTKLQSVRKETIVIILMKPPSFPWKDWKQHEMLSVIFRVEYYVFHPED
jgi:hypothetical protein